MRKPRIYVEKANFTVYRWEDVLASENAQYQVDFTFEDGVCECEGSFARLEEAVKYMDMRIEQKKQQEEEYAEGLREIARQSEIDSFKNDIPILRELNKQLKNKKVDLLLNLAENVACSYGELKNSMTICYRLFVNAGLIA